MNKFKNYLLFFVILSLFVGCGSGSGGGPEEAAEREAENTMVITAGSESADVKKYSNHGGKGDKTLTITLSKSGFYLFRFAFNESYGTNKDGMVRVKRGDDIVHYIVRKPSQNIKTDAVVLSRFDVGAGETGAYSFEIDVPSDEDEWDFDIVYSGDFPSNLKKAFILKEEVAKVDGDDILYAHQWHLKNTGQSSYSNVPAVANEDINVESVWSENITGKGIRVAVIDEGVEINHPDLIDNIDLDLSWNYLSNSHDTTPTNPNNAHGTAVAGIIAAKGWNGIGGRGVAPDASIVSYNMLEGQIITAEYFNLALESLVRDISQIDIYNNSWGMESGTLYENHDLGSYYSQFANQLHYGVLHGRGGKGSIYVKSAGNDRYQNVDGLYKKYWDANYNPEQVERYMIVVGASDADGTYAWYSNPGENILVSAPGGSTQSYFLEANQQMIVTTDLSGKEQGSDYEAFSGLDITHFNVKGNENYDYTNRMNGTSAAGPIVSGVVALMLEANPDLTWRDVRYILAKTAQNETTNYRDTLPTVPTLTNMIFWNPSRVYDKNLGFGRVNAAQAIAVAKYWNTHNIKLSLELNSYVSNGTYVNSIFSSSEARAEVDFDFSNALVSRVEYVNVQFSIIENNSTLPPANKYEVVLISNNDTKAKLIDYDFVDSTNGLDADAVFYKTRMGANRFLDEDPRGEWRLQVRAKELDENLSFRLDNLRVEIYGR